ncbi:MAG: class I SAM-dependent methyltransferase [Deltaproteobacteria bacterium]|nr:class I SAM-dependent methyltransferase [Deltaproteobacteria bacterium]MBW2085262.1 class I SAM-dependent methyltransferase [Deltaproteobacteria bacterium]
MKTYEEALARLLENPKEFFVFQEYRDDRGRHPENFLDFECQFATDQISKFDPENILDIGSYRHFLMGLMAHYQVTTIDVRDRESSLNNETVVTCDATRLDFPDDSFEAVLSMCTLEHVGLGRYGDPIDLDGDKKAMHEMVRVLKPEGVLIFTTTIHNAPPAIAFNAHRIYNYKMIKSFCVDLERVTEKFFSHQTGNFCSIERITTDPRWWDVYCGCWRKT